jgi:hypothetical protein
MYGVAKVLETLSPENIDQNLAVFEKRHSAWNDTEIRAFMTAWTRFDPEAAFAWASGSRGFTRAKFVKFALWAWASVDPQGAVGAFDAIPAGKREQQEFQLELVKGWIRGGDSDGATEYILSLGSGRQNAMLVNRMANWIATEGADTVIDWAEAIPEDEDDNWAREAAFRAAVGAVAKLDASRAAAWYEVHREHDYAAPALKTLAFTWQTNGDPVALFEWLQQQPDGKLRVETIRQSYRRWLKNDPEAAVAWIRSATLTPALDPAVAVFARLESRISPESAVEWANRIEDQSLQRLTIIPILRIWATEDSAAALHWMDEHSYPVSVRNDIIRRLPKAADEKKREMEGAGEATPATTATTAAP